MSPALRPPERPSHTHAPKPGFGGRGHEENIKKLIGRKYARPHMKFYYNRIFRQKQFKRPSVDDCKHETLVDGGVGEHARSRPRVTPAGHLWGIVVVVVVFLTLTDPLRIQPWSQDRRNQTKSNRESEISRESRHKRTDKKEASKGHRRDKTETQTKTHRQ